MRRMSSIGILILLALFLVATSRRLVNHPESRSASFAFADRQSAVLKQYLNCCDEIVMGLTPLAKTYTLLNAHYGYDGIIDSRSAFWDANSGGVVRGVWISRNDQGQLDYFIIAFVEGQYTVTDLITQIGKPDFVYVAMSFSPEFDCAAAFFFYPAVGVSAYLDPYGKSVGVRPTQNVYRIEFMSFAEAQAFYITDHAKVEWQGYQDYCELTYGKDD
jgi:hypothetical protein